LDSGYGIKQIHPKQVEALVLKKTGRLDIIGSAGREEAGLRD